MRARRPGPALTGALLVVLLLSAGAPAAPVEQVILVLWHGLDWDDAVLLQLPGPVALGLLNTRPGGGDSLTGSYLSIGAGARAVGWAGAARFLPRETAEHLFRLHTGLDPGAFVQPDIALLHAAQAVEYPIEIGALGTALYEAGETVEVFGRSTADDDFHWAALIGMDRFGRIWSGKLAGEFTSSDPRYPFGLRTHYASLAEAVLAAEGKLVIVDLGDPFRFDRYQEYLLPGQVEVARTVMAAEAGQFIQRLAVNRPEGTVIFLTSPHPGREAAEGGKWLTPVLCLGLEDGLLVSATTRWPGLITNMDLAPTILELLEIDYDRPFIGRTAWVEQAADASALLGAAVSRIEALFRWRTPLLRLVVTAQIGTYAAVLAALAWGPPLPRWIVRLLQTALLILLSVPLALLFWDWGSLLSAGLVLAAALLFLRWPRPLLWVGVISLFTAIALSVDVLGGSWLMRYSPFGYDPVAGARFYGIGNEYMGVLVGAGIMAWSALGGRITSSSRLPTTLGLLASAGLVVLIGAPALGTNAGGAVSAVCGLGTCWLALSQPRAGWRAGLLVALCAVLVLGAFTLLDAANPEAEQSHIGQAAGLLRRDGLRAALQIIKRKLAMNFRLLRSSIWSKALIVTLAAMAGSFIWPSRFIAWLKENHPHASQGIGAVVVGAVAALLFNDSGVVAASTCISFGSSPLLLMALELRLKLEHDLTPPQPNIEDHGHSQEAGDHSTASGSDEREGQPGDGHHAQGHPHIDH